MKPDRSLSFWRQVVALRAEAFAGLPDAELVERFAQRGDAEAFEEITRRHGGMVWAACRQMLPRAADAEDAFQATFLAFVQSAGRVRGSVGAWLHGTAVRGALKTRRAAVRARQRDRRTAKPEAAPVEVEANWGELLAAVHEEVNRLPEALRTAFVTCDLEGVSQPDAAARLGWKPGTLTGRLSKARKRLLDALTRRGLAPALTGGVLGLGAATSSADVPAVLLTAIWKFPTAAPAAIPAALATLAMEIAPMTVPKVKLLALAAMMSAGLAAGTGTVWVPSADGQVPGGPPPAKADPPAKPQLAPSVSQPAAEPPAFDPNAGYFVKPPREDPAVTAKKQAAETEELAQRRRDGAMLNAISNLGADQLPVSYRFVPRQMRPNETPNYMAHLSVIATETKEGWEFAGTFVTEMPEWEYKQLLTSEVQQPPSYKPTKCTVFVFKRAKMPAGPSAATAPSAVSPAPSRTAQVPDATPPVKPSGEAVICMMPFTVTERDGNTNITYTYAVGDLVPERHVKYVSDIRRVIKGERAKPAQLAPMPPGGFNPLSVLGGSGNAPLPAAKPQPAPEPVVVQVHALAPDVVGTLVQKVLPKTVEWVAVPQLNCVILLNATPQDVVTLKKVLDKIDSYTAPRPDLPAARSRQTTPPGRTSAAFRDRPADGAPHAADRGRAATSDAEIGGAPQVQAEGSSSHT